MKSKVLLCFDGQDVSISIQSVMCDPFEMKTAGFLCVSAVLPMGGVVLVDRCHEVNEVLDLLRVCI